MPDGSDNDEEAFISDNDEDANYVNDEDDEDMEVECEEEISEERLLDAKTELPIKRKKAQATNG